MKGKEQEIGMILKTKTEKKKTGSVENAISCRAKKEFAERRRSHAQYWLLRD